MDNLNLQQILRIVRRRFWIWCPLLCIGVTASVSAALFLPNLYRASAFILVEGQQIPENYVQSTVTGDIQNRLHSISQEILSRTRLEGLVQEYNLYPKLRSGVSLQQAIEAMRGDIGIEIKNVGKGGRGEESSVAFEVSYIGRDPEKVTRVANRLASFYIEENLKLRERQALGTTDFLSDQLRGVKKHLEEQEQKVALFKRENLGALPEQLDANLRTLERLQSNLQLNSDSLGRTRERLDPLVKELDQYRRAISSKGEEDGDEAPLLVSGVDELDKEIEVLTRTLAVLRGRFSENHPDIVHARQKLEALQNEQNARAEGTETSGKGFKSAPKDPYLTEIQKQIRDAKAEIRFLTQDIKDTRKEITVYQKRIEETPRREQQLTSLSRDYESTRTLYASLLKRREEAELATSMEQRQKAERFRIIDPAILPSSPEGPNRPSLLLIGLALSVGLAGGTAFLRQTMDDSFDTVEDLQKFTSTPILVSIPRIRTKADRLRGYFKTAFATVLLIISLGTVGTASYYVAKDNEKLVRSVTSFTRTQQLR